MGHTVLVVPVPELEMFVRSRWEHYDAAWVSPDPRFTHAHITALAPWVPTPGPADLARVGEIVASITPFDFELLDVAAFPDGTVHAPPVPAEPFESLTAGLVAAFPEHLPYGGAFGDVVPHLTLDRLTADVTVESVLTMLGGTLPARCRAARLELQWYDEGECRVLETWRFGG